MAALYGRLQGNRGEATRCGSDQLEASLETWEGKVHVWLGRDGACAVSVSGKYGEGRRTVWRGNVNDRDEDRTGITLDRQA